MHKQQLDVQRKHLRMPDRLVKGGSGVGRHRSRGINSSRASSRIARGSDPASSNYEHHCRLLESGAALCRAKIATTAGGGGRGMVATQQIAAGESVLEVAAASVLSVPKHAEAVNAWREWLSLHTAVHGDLPDVLVEFLADTTLHHSMRLATWLLFLKQQCSSSSSSISPYWRSYIAVLQESGAMTAVCTGAWQHAELQLLEPQVMRDWLCCHHHHARKATLAAYSTVAGGRWPVANLGLASSSADVGWALGLVKTRAHGDAARLTLYPLHDMINHRERGLANVRRGAAAAAAAGVGYVLQAVSGIQPGEEITNCYTAPMANPQMLLGWGFTQPAKRADWVMAVPLHYGVLPQIPWKLAVHAAANVALRYTQQFDQGHVCGSDHQLRHKQQQQQQQSEAGPCKQTLDSANSEDHIARVVTAAANLPLQLPDSIWDGGLSYTAAAAGLAAHLTRHLPQQQQQPNDRFMPLIGSTLQHEKIETLLLRELRTCMHQRQQEREQQVTGGRQRQQQQQQLQWSTAAVIRQACLIQLYACNTNIAQDKMLLQQLLQQQNAPTVQLHTLLPPSSQQQQQQQQHQVHARQLAVQQLDQLQQQLVRSLALLSAYSNLQSMCEATAAAAHTVLQVLQEEMREIEHKLQLPSWQHEGPHLKAATTSMLLHFQPHMHLMLQQQDSLLRQLLCFQQDKYISPGGDVLQQQQHTSPTNNTCTGLPDQQQPREPSAGASLLHPARVAAAVAARLEQKQLLAATAELCEELCHLLAAPDKHM